MPALPCPPAASQVVLHEDRILEKPKDEAKVGGGLQPGAPAVRERGP